MCGRFASTIPPERIREIFATLATEASNHPSSWNVAPTQSALVVRRHPETGERRLDAFTWGLILSFVADLKGGQKPINARAETVASLAMFRGALLRRRCLVPADVFYEWKAVARNKQPYAFARANGTPLAFAGLWEIWRDPAGEFRRTFAIITTAANATMEPIHSRMPVILEPDMWPVWLGEKRGDAAALLRPAAEDVMRTWPVSGEVNSLRNDRADLLDPVKLPRSPENEDEAVPDSA